MGELVELIDTIRLDESATSLDFYHDFIQGWYKFNLHSYLLAVGLENGLIVLLYLKYQGQTLSLEKKVLLSHEHTKVVKSLHWRPGKYGAQLQLSSCSEDGSLRIYTVDP